MYLALKVSKFVHQLAPIKRINTMSKKIVNCSGCKTYPCYQGDDCVRGQNFNEYELRTKTEY